MPTTLCREFELVGFLNGNREVILEVSDNRKRAYHIECGKSYDRISLIPKRVWGDGEYVPVISFDFV
jgi:hypothetical protein